MIKQYVKKPVIISAMQFTGTNVEGLFDFAGQNAEYDKDKKQYFIKTLEGNHYITLGDYIIKGIEDEFYPCKEHIFNKTYMQI